MTAPLSTNSAAVATHHPLATVAARKILRAGGNAIDAAVAALSTVCVVLPQQCGFGGFGGSMVVQLAPTDNQAHNRPGKAIALDFDSRAPLAFRDDLFSGDHSDKSTCGYLAVTVPAVVAGMGFALREFGTMPWAAVTENAIDLAERGFTVDAETRRQLETWFAGADPVSIRALFSNGKLPAIGELWIQKDLAAMLRILATQGPEAFYHGEIPRRIVKQVREHGGVLSEEDFARYQPTLVEPLRIDYRGHALFTPPPPSGGISMLQILKTLEQFDLSKLAPWSADYFHLLVEAAKLCWADRAMCLGDPDFVKMPIEDLLSAPSAAARAAKINRNGIGLAAENPIDTGPHTSNVSIIDGQGNVVSITATQGNLFGSGVVIDGLGLLMGQGMSRFDFVPGHPNRPAPGKRMHHNMSPTIATKQGRPFAAVGLPGGPKIITVTAQLLAGLIDFAATARQAIDAPRVHTDCGEPIGISAWADDAIIARLESLGHTLERGQSIGGPPGDIAGAANVVRVDPTGPLDAASGAAPDASAIL
ncbi:MAG: gamma-glutamyltransferase [Tepidisphaeraceae bacterium]